jgi:hypothetical protein
MNYTSIEQSKILLELGLNPKTADMYYKQIVSNRTDMPYYDIIIGHSFAVEQNLFSFRNDYEIPCWSVGALLDIMPPFITTSQDIYHFKALEAGCGYSVRYESDIHEVLLSSYQQELIDACCELIRLLFTLDYISKTT